MKEKAISVKQPWAYLICAGIKDVENRTWATKYRGRVYIHASAKGEKNSYGCLNYEQRNAILHTSISSINFKDLPFSAIIGHVDIVDCVVNYPSIWAERSIIHQANESDPDTEDDLIIYNWVLANPVLFDEPILNVKGKLSFWDCSNIIHSELDEDID